MSPTPGTRWVVGLSTAVVAACGFVVVATSTRDHYEPVSPRAGTDLITAAGLGRMLDDIDLQLGSSEVDSMTIHPDYASISRSVPGVPGSEQSFRYEDGQLTDTGRSPGRTAGVPVDLAVLRANVPRLIGLVYGADRTLGVDNPTSAYLIVDRDDDTGAVVGIYLSNEDTGTDGFMTVGFDGEVRSVHRADR
ncbi:hypothetical protein RHDE110596_03730 [Prescottella defluvii]